MTTASKIARKSAIAFLFGMIVLTGVTAQAMEKEQDKQSHPCADVVLYSSVDMRNDAIINLGGDCQSAYQMRINGVRRYALPFDKLVTPFPALQKLLENKFDQFLKVENLELRGSDERQYILDTHYDVRLLHDFSKYDVRLLHDFSKEEGFLKEYEIVKATYDRRIARFLTLVAESKKPLFIRKNITKEQAVTLSAVLSTMCKHKNFTVLALDGTEGIKENWDIENVTNMNLRQLEPYTWKGDTLAWREVFTAVGLTPTSKDDSSAEI